MPETLAEPCAGVAAPGCSAAPGACAGARPVVVDTNIALDLLVFSDAAATSLRRALDAGRLRWIATPAMRCELALVLAYPHIAARLQRHALEAAAVLAGFDARVRLLQEAPRASCVCKDADDQKFIDLAAEHGALLLSKDRAVLRLRKRLAERHGAQVAAACPDSV